MVKPAPVGGVANIVATLNLISCIDNSLSSVTAEKVSVIANLKMYAGYLDYLIRLSFTTHMNI